MKQSNNCLSQFAIDLFLLGEVDQSTRDQYQKHINGCVRCQKIIREKRAAISNYHERGIESKVLATLKETRISRTSPGFSNVFAWLKQSLRLPILIPAVSVCVVAFLVFRGIGPEKLNPQMSPDYFTIKGEDTVNYKVLRGNRLLERSDVTVYQAGDKLQFYYSSTKAQTLLIFSVDERWRLSWYYPMDGKTSMTIAKGHQQVLPWSIELDDSGVDEIVFAIFSEVPIKKSAIQVLIDNMRLKNLTIDQLKLPKKFNYRAFPLVKRR